MPNDEQDSTGPDAATEAADFPEPSESSNEEGDPDLEGQEQADEEHISATRYQAIVDRSSGNVASVVGDNPRVTINYYIQMLNDAKRESLHDDEIAPQKRSVPDSSSKYDKQLQEQYIENLKFERQNTTFFASTEVGKAQLPNDEQQISQWYYALDEYEQCYVQATAVLHGAPAHEVSKRAENLYYIIYESAERQQGFLPPSSEQEKPLDTQQPAFRAIDLPLQKKPARELRASTHTLTRRGNGAERVFWKDVDEHGLSAFGLRLLIFLANEFTNHGQQGQRFLDNLNAWSTENNDECSWRSARAYGVVLWYQHADQLYQVAKKWGTTRSIRRRWKAASLLDGAYEIECSKLKDIQANDSSASSVLQLLDDWASPVNTQLSVSTSNLRCTAANAYGLIGKKSPDIALTRLARLLQLPESQATHEANDVFAAGVSTYISLIWSGHIRKVLEHLAEIAEALSHQRSLFNTMKERQRYRQQREVRLNAVFETFFFVAAASCAERYDDGFGFYTVTDPLPLEPAVPDTHKRDVLLAGLLVEEEIRWRAHITTLLCAAIIEKRSVSAFDLLHSWASIVLEMRERKISSSELIYRQFRQFMVDLGKAIDTWCRDIEHRDGEQRLRRSPKAIAAYKYRLEQWQKPRRSHERPLLSTLAQEILKQFSRESISVRH